jgi:hypothetical protein
MMTSSPTKVKAALRDERVVEFMPETMIFPPPVSSHSSAMLIWQAISKNFFCFTFFQKLFGLGGSGSSQCKHTFHHEKKSPVHLRAGTGLARLGCHP